MGVLGRIGIAYPIYNSRWNICKMKPTIFSPGASAEIQTVSIPTGITGDYDRFFGPGPQSYTGVMKEYFGKLNRLILGPSTHSSNVGATEELIVASVSSLTSVYTQSDRIYSYTNGDPCTIIGIGMPDGWSGYTSSAYFAAGSTIGVFGDTLGKYGFNIYYATYTSYDSFCYQGLYYPLLSGMKYRLGVYYKGINPTFNTSAVMFKLGYGASSFTINAQNVTDWTEDYVIFETPADISGGSSYALYVYMPVVSGSPGISIDSINITTAPYDSTDYSYGLTIFDEYPKSSIAVKKNRISSRLGQDSQGFKYAKSISSGQFLPMDVYSIRYSMSFVPESIWRKIEKILEVQSRGFLVNHFPGLIGIPHCLTGRISANIIRRHNIANISYTDFDLVFQEVLV